MLDKIEMDRPETQLIQAALSSKTKLGDFILGTKDNALIWKIWQGNQS